uniref:C4-type zinc ribbon domain-containing protein n=1 Tax=candidate division WOR-3 bacterium TaxID=2052148 RepID=A0A7C4TE73_UNCW3
MAGIDKKEEIMMHLKSLFDLDNLIVDMQAYKKVGFKIEEDIGLINLKKMRAEILKKIPKEYSDAYERLRKRYPLAIAEVKNGFCFGCFQQLPTEMLTKQKDIVTCPNCGRILFWREE